MTRPPLLLTGVGSGVGLSLAGHLQARFEVIGIARRREAAQAALAGAVVELHAADLTRPAELDACLDGVLERHGHLPYVVNNAGVHHAGTVVELAHAAVSDSLEVHVLAPLRIMQRVLPAMAERGFGRIVNVTSGAAFNCVPGHAAYSASKAALNALTVTAAREHAGANVRINLLSPGPVRSAMAPEAPLDPSACHPTLDYLLDPDPACPNGRLFWLGRELPLFPDLDGVSWLEGSASDRFRRVV